MLLVSLLATVALVSMQYEFVSGALIQTNKGVNENNLLSNVLPTTHHRRLSRSKFVHVSQAPPDTARHEPGVDLELTCVVMGSPAPRIVWLRNGEPIEEISNEEMNEVFTVSAMSVATVTSTIIISEPSPNPHDVYTCVGVAGDMKAEATTVVTDNENAAEFLQKLLVTHSGSLPSKPRIIYYYQAILVSGFGSTLVLPCRVHSDLKVHLYWTDNDGKVVLDNSKTEVLPTGDLLIRDVQWSEMGDWTCVVQNFIGEDSKTTFFYPAPLA